MRNVRISFFKTTFLSCFVLMLALQLDSQSTANYTFATNTTGSLVLDANNNAIDMTSGTSSLIATTSSDQGVSAVSSIGFNFLLMGNLYTQFSVSANGIIQLGSSAVSGSTYVASGGTITSPKISAFGADLGTGTSGSVKSKVVGTAPNRCLVIEFNNMTLLWTSNYTNDGTFQTRLYENGVVEYVYGSMSITSTSSAADATVSIGFSTNTTANNFVYITTSTNTSTTSGSFTDNPTYPTGAIANLNSASDGSRRVYTFTPPAAIPTAPTWVTPTAINSSGMTLNWTDNATDEIGYIIMRSTDNINFTQQGTLLAANSNTSVITGLAPSTLYYWKIIAVREGTGAEASGSETTSAASTYYWVGSSGSTWNTPANWNSAADGTGSTRSIVATTDILIVDGAGTTAGAATTISVDLASFSIGQFKVTNNTACTLQSSATTTRTITITGGIGTDYLIESGSALNLTNASNAVAFTFSGTGNVGDISGTLNFAGSTSNVLTTTGGTGTLVTVSATGIVNLGATGNSLVGSVATLSFLDGANCNSTGATTGAPPVPLATWATTSNLTITGITTSTTAPTNNAQSFGNLIYNCPSASGTMSFFTSTTTAVIKGNFTITAGATGGTGIFRAVTSGTVTINGNVIVNQGRLQSASGAGTFIVLGNTTNNSNGIIDILAGTYSQRGATFTNDGIITGPAGTLQFLNFTGSFGQTLAGTGTVLTNIATLSLQNTAGFTINHTNQIILARVNLFQGTITNSNKITIGTGAAVSCITQIGSVGLTTPGGSFSSAPVFNLGTGTYSLIYQQESVSRTTGFEIPSSRAVTNVTINNTNGVTLNGGDLTLGTTSVVGLLTLTAGIFNANGSSVILPNTGTTLSGGSSSSYIDGKLVRSFPASRTAVGTYTAATLFPIGKSGNYLPINIDPTTTAGGSVTFSGEAFLTNSGTLGSGVSTLSSTRWEALPISGSTNLTNSFLRLTDGAILGSNKILQSTTASGAYSSIAPVSNYSVGPPVTLTTATSLPSASYFGFLAYGDVTPCTVPTNQPTGLTYSNLGGTSLTGTFTAAIGNPSHYLVVRYPNLASVTDPVDFIQYTIGTNLGVGQVRGVLTSPTVTFNDSGLSPGTTYDYYVYSYSNSACNGPVYLTSAPLKASVTTCAATTGTPGTPTASAVGITSFTSSWTASSTPGVNYIVDVATDLGFTNFVSGYNGLNVGGLLSIPVNGLSGNTTYYVRVRADLAGCVSVNSSTLTVTTECNAITTFPSTEPFATYLPSTCWKEGDLGDLTTGPSIISATASSWAVDGFLNVGTTGAAKINIDAATDNDWLITPFFTIPANGYRVKYSIGATQFAATTAPTTPWETDDFVELVVSTGTTNWTVLKTYNSTNVPSHLGQIDFSDLSAYNGQTVRFAFRGVEGASNGSADIDFFIDNFVLELTPSPTITSLSTLSGCPGSTLVINGTNLEGVIANNVTIGGTPVSSITSNNGTALTVVVGSGSTGKIEVTIGGNTTISSETYTVNAAPTATASSNTPVCAGNALNLNGTTDTGTSYTWTGPNSFTSMSEDPSIPNVTLLSSGTYTFTTIRSSDGCISAPATTVVSILPNPSSISIDPSAVTKCASDIPILLTAIGGDVEATVGSGVNFTSATEQPTAFCNRWSEYIGQQIYTAAELTAAGHTAGNLTSIAFNLSSLGDAATNDNYLISIGHVGSLVTFPSTSFLSTAGYTTVYGPVTHNHTATGWQVITFSTPFNWNGVDNICIHMTHDGIDDLNNAQTQFTTTSGNSTLTYTTSTIGGTSTTGTLSTKRLNIRLTPSATTTKIWSPTTGLFTDAAATIAYTGTSTNTVYAKPVTTETYTVTASSAAPVTYDGTITESAWGSSLATSAGGPTPGFGAGHEINALYVQANHEDINFGIAGDVQDGNRILLFIDSKTGGYTNGSFGRTGAPQGIDDFNSGTTFDAGFEADYCLVIGTNGAHSNFFFDLYTLSAGGGPAVYLGDDSNPKIGADPLGASNTRGFELAIAKSLLGYIGGPVKTFAMYTSDGGFLSNQFLTRASAADGNYGSGAVTFSAALPDPITVPNVNLNNYCTSSASVTVGVEGTIVKNTADTGLHSLRSVYNCINEGGTITYDQGGMPATSTTVLTTPLNITKSVTIQGLSAASRPEITVPAAGVSIDATKTLTLQNVDVKSNGTATFTGTGNVSITGTTVGKQ